MNELDVETERAALWIAIASDCPELDVDEALRVASAELAEMLMFAVEWDNAAEAMQSAAPIARAA